MIRTRDLFLFLSTVLLLLVGIATTVIQGVYTSSNQMGTVFLANETFLPPPIEQDAVVISNDSPNREERLADMRAQVAALNLVPAARESEGAPDMPATEDGESNSAVSTVMECRTYARVPWPDMPGVQFRVVEGARLLYRAVSPSVQPMAATTSTSTFVTEPTITEMVLAQLPLRDLPQSPVCISQDVVAVALDGSLIRNNEAGLYSVFGSDTLVGYALDGFPLYGVSGLPTDDCGGAVVGGTYRYYLATDRETVLNCFAATPVSL